MNIKWCKKCEHLGTRHDAYSRWFAVCQYPQWNVASREKHIVSFYYNKMFPGDTLYHLMNYDDKSNYTEKEMFMKPDLNIIPEPSFQKPPGCPWVLESLLTEQDK